MEKRVKRPVLPLRLSYLISILASAFVGVALLRCAHAQELESVPVQLEDANGGMSGPVAGPAAEAILHGPLSNDRAELIRHKALAARQLGILSSPQTANALPKSATAAPITAAPIMVLGKKGVFENDVAPSDSTGAIGTQRYIELINSQVGIYDRQLNLLKQDSLTNLFAESGADNFDVQIIWDPSTNRFYYAGDAVFSTSDNRIAVGFSKTAAPSNATTDWCHYQYRFGSDFPDFPKLGDSTSFLVIGFNVFDVSNSYVGSDIEAISKPPAGTTCPLKSTFKAALAQNITIGGAQFFTPVPANEIDSNPTARIVSRQLNLPGTQIGLFSVRANAKGYPVFPAGTVLNVNLYDVPPAAPQKGTSFTIDTLDARMTQAVGAIDPRFGKFAVWTQHTIAGGAGSKVRWYEIDPVGNTLLQSGNVGSARQFYFNAAISPDRVVNGAVRAFGSNMLLNFDASASSDFESIEMVWKRDANSVSLPTAIKRSTGPDTDTSCVDTGVCRWGDYAAATPDPSASISAPGGKVWSTSMWTVPGPSGGNPSWRTWNWKARN